MYELIVCVCVIIIVLDVCIVVSKGEFVTDIEQDREDQEQIQYLEKWSRHKENI